MRNSNIEFLRIISILMIVIMHVYGQYQTVDDALVYHSSMFCNAICNTGVSLFVLISGYYGIKSNLKKWLSLYNVTTFYGIIFLIACLIRPNDVVNATLIVKCIFPVFFNKYWFITSYLLLMALSNYIEKMLNALSREEHKTLILVLTLFVIISPTLFIFEIFNDSGKGFMNMLTMYIIGRYVARYDFPQLIHKYSKLLVPLMTFVIWMGNELIDRYTGNRGHLCRDNNVLIVISAVCIFYLFISTADRHNETINKFAKYVFPIYLVHGIFIEDVSIYLQTTGIPYILQIFASIVILTLLSITVEAIRKLVLDWAFSRVAEIESKCIERLCHNDRKSGGFASTLIFCTVISCVFFQ